MLIVRSRIYTAIAVSLGLTFIVLSQLNQLSQSGARTTSQAQALLKQEQQKATLSFLRDTPKFGFQNLTSSYVFLNFLQYFGDDIERSQVGYDLSPDYFEAILASDPFPTEIYPYLFTASSFYAGQPQRTVEIVGQSLRKMDAMFPPQGYFLWRYKAIDQMLLLNDIPNTIQSLEMAAVWAEQQIDDSDAATVVQVSRSTIQFLQTNPDSRVARASAWSNVLVRAIDDNTRERAMTEIVQLGGEVTITESGAVRVFLPKQD